MPDGLSQPSGITLSRKWNENDETDICKKDGVYWNAGGCFSGIDAAESVATVCTGILSRFQGCMLREIAAEAGLVYNIPHPCWGRASVSHRHWDGKSGCIWLEIRRISKMKADVQYLKSLVDDIHSTTIATIGADGHPQTRVIDMMLYGKQGIGGVLPV